MPSKLDSIKDAFIRHGTKAVTRTDKVKAAYVLTKIQVDVLAAAGLVPDRERVVPVRVMGTDTILESTYYRSERLNSGRRPEPRMGRELVGWLQVGDRLLLATDGKSVFARKLLGADLESATTDDAVEIVERVYAQISDRQLLARAKLAKGLPVRSKITVDQFVRNPAVKEFAVRRSDGRCEVPSCGWEGFRKDDDEQFMEVHHIKFLKAGGEDSILNTCAICPNCHAKAHFGRDRHALAAILKRTVRIVTKAFEKKSRRRT